MLSPMPDEPPVTRATGEVMGGAYGRLMADLEETLHPFVDSGDIPGLVALVARGEDVEVVALGTRDSSGTPMGRDALFRGASITKPVTAALAMALVEDGRIDLDAPVADLLPELAEPRVLRTLESPLDDTVACERPITARHLLTGRRATASARGSRRSRRC